MPQGEQALQALESEYDLPTVTIKLQGLRGRAPLGGQGGQHHDKSREKQSLRLENIAMLARFSRGFSLRAFGRDMRLANHAQSQRKAPVRSEELATQSWRATCRLVALLVEASVSERLKENQYALPQTPKLTPFGCVRWPGLVLRLTLFFRLFHRAP